MRKANRAFLGRGLMPAMVILAAAASPALGAEASRAPAGTLADGTAIETVTLSNGHGVTARILSYGATLQSLSAPDRNGKAADVLLGYDDLAGYVEHPSFFGVTAGRYANRIAGGTFILDGRNYQLPINSGGNTLHGGPKGFDKIAWKVASVTSGSVARVILSHLSPDGDQGFPGTLDATVSYSLDESGALTIAFDAKTDKPTVVNMTNHAIFNLAGEGTAVGALGHVLTIPAKAYTPVNAKLIPTGELKPVAGTPFDFRTPHRVGDRARDGRDQQILYGRGYDHNFALDKGLTKTPELAARLEDPGSGRVLEVLTTEPGLQLYTSNSPSAFPGKHGHLYRQGDGIALEPQKFPDSPNQPGFVSTRIDPDKPYHHVMVYRLSVKR